MKNIKRCNHKSPVAETGKDKMTVFHATSYDNEIDIHEEITIDIERCFLCNAVRLPCGKWMSELKLETQLS